jgi:hypothetical protein
MKEWTIKVFVDENGKSDFYEWRDKLPKKARQKLRWVIDNMEITEDWIPSKYFRLLPGGIGEIRFNIHNRQFRPLGCYGPGEGEFTILIGAEEKGDRFKPLRVLDIAKERRQLIRDDERYSDEYF